jgi:hypothetical protein
MAIWHRIVSTRTPVVEEKVHHIATVHRFQSYFVAKIGLNGILWIHTLTHTHTHTHTHTGLRHTKLVGAVRNSHHQFTRYIGAAANPI